MAGFACMTADSSPLHSVMMEEMDFSGTFKHTLTHANSAILRETVRL